MLPRNNIIPPAHPLPAAERSLQCRSRVVIANPVRRLALDPFTHILEQQYKRTNINRLADITQTYIVKSSHKWTDAVEHAEYDESFIIKEGPLSVYFLL